MKNHGKTMKRSMENDGKTIEKPRNRSRAALFQDLRRHVMNRADLRGERAQVETLRGAEVDQLHLAVLRKLL